MLFESNNEDGGDDGLYNGYVPTTVDTGNIPLILSLVVCAITLLAVPLMVTLIRRHQHSTDETYDAHAGPTDSDDNHDAEGYAFDISEDMDEPSVLDVGAGIRRRRRGAARADNVVKRRLQVQRGIAEECRTSAIRRQTEEERVGGVSIVINRDGVEAYEHSPPPAPNKVTWRQKISHSVDFYLDLVSYDDETRRILRLAVPFTASALVETVLGLVELAIVSFYLGTEAMVAFVLVDIIVGISSAFVGGFIESVSSLTSMASGAGNNRVCGEYLQISTGFYFLFQIPFVFVWSFAVEPIVLLMGFDEYTSSIAKDFGRVAIFVDIAGGISEGFYDFLEVIDHEAFANIMGCIEACVETGLIALFAIKTSAGLVIIGLVMIVNVCFFLLLNIAIAVNKGWLKAFEFGLIGRCAFRNRAAVRQVVKTAVPLAFGSLMAYAEWEILTVFAAFLGPAEAASWAILSFLWDTFEATTQGIGGAAEIRCAYHLGKNRPDRAKRSSYKSIHLSAILALIATAIVLLLRDDIPTWLTSDPTLQHMLGQQIPLIGIGNITMNMGMVAWALIGSQGRYRLATSIALACSWLITIPLAAVVTYGLNIDLRGLTFSIIVGYAVTASLLSVVLIISDWETIAQKLFDLHAITGEVDSSDSDSDDDDSVSSMSSSSPPSSSSSSSSSSSKSSDPVPERYRYIKKK